MEKRLLAGITPNNEIYFMTIEDDKGYFSMTGFTVIPIEYEKAKDIAQQQLEDGELWKMAVEDGTTKLGKNEWNRHVLNTDGELSTLDLSLYPEKIEIDGNTYVFESGSCGQHREKRLEHYFIPRNIFDKLNRIWDKYHLKKKSPKLPKISKQNEEANN